MLTNSLSGPAGDTLNAHRVAETGTPVDLGAPGRAVYSSEQTVRSLSTVATTTGHHPADTPRLTVDLPTEPWAVRFYLWLPPLQQAGNGISEVRTVARLGSWLWVVHDTVSGNIGARLHNPYDLTAPSRQWDHQDGQAVPTGVWWRIDMTFSDRVLVVTATDEATGNARIHTWDGIAITGRLELTGYRWRRGAFLEWNSLNPEVEAYQLRLVDLGYELPTYGADGHYGQETAAAIEAFQGDQGMPVGAGEDQGGAGPETLAALDLAHAEQVTGAGPPEPVFLSHLALTTSTDPVGAAGTPWGTASGVLEVRTPTATGHKHGHGYAQGTLTVEGGAQGESAITGVRGRLTVAGDTQGRKHTQGTATGGLVLEGTATGRKRGCGLAQGALVVGGTTAQGRHPVPALGGQLVADQLAATATREGDGWLPSNG